MKVLVYFSPRNAQGVNEWKVVARRVVMRGGGMKRRVGGSSEHKTNL